MTFGPIRPELVLKMSQEDNAHALLSGSYITRTWWRSRTCSSHVSNVVGPGFRPGHCTKLPGRSWWMSSGGWWKPSVGDICDVCWSSWPQDGWMFFWPCSGTKGAPDVWVTPWSIFSWGYPAPCQVWLWWQREDSGVWVFLDPFQPFSDMYSLAPMGRWTVSHANTYPLALLPLGGHCHRLPVRFPRRDHKIFYELKKKKDIKPQ